MIKSAIVELNNIQWQWCGEDEGKTSEEMKEAANNLPKNLTVLYYKKPNDVKLTSHRDIYLQVIDTAEENYGNATFIISYIENMKVIFKSEKPVVINGEEQNGLT